MMGGCLTSVSGGQGCRATRDPLHPVLGPSWAGLPFPGVGRRGAKLLADLEEAADCRAPAQEGGCRLEWVGPGGSEKAVHQERTQELREFSHALSAFSKRALELLLSEQLVVICVQEGPEALEKDHDFGDHVSD